MKADNLKSLLREIPQTQSYTPSSFIKGFVPAALIASQTPGTSSKKSKSQALSPEAAAALKKSIDSLAYYRNPLPPEIKNITIKRSTRSKTIKIFKTKIEMVKDMDAMAPAGPNVGKKVLITDQIFRRDSLKTVQYLVGRNEQQPKEKPKGSMYVNELWSRGYEKYVMEATRLDADIKQVNMDNNRPLGEKMEDLFKLYERTQQELGIKDMLEDIKLHKSLTLQMPTSPVGSTVRDSEQVLGLRMARSLVVTPSTTEQKAQQEKALSPGNGKRAKARVGTSLGSVRLVKKGSIEKDYMKDTVQSTRVDSKEFSPGRKKTGITLHTLKSRLEDIESEKSSLAELKDACSAGELLDSPCSIMKMPSNSQSATTTTFYINKQRWRQKQRGTSMEIQDGKIFNFNSASPSPNTSINTSQNFFKKPMSMSFYNKKSPGRSKECRTVSNLIMQCDNELGDRGECMNMINDLRGRLTESKGFNWKEKVEDMGKQKIIQELRYMLHKRDVAEKGRRMRTGTAE